MSTKPFLAIGMDVGSTTVKATVVDPDSKAILWSDYQRHHTKQPEKVLELLETILHTIQIHYVSWLAPFTAVTSRCVRPNMLRWRSG